jgi:hypothetical protein
VAKTEDALPSFLSDSGSSLADRMVYCITVHLYAKDDPECIRKLKNKLIEASRVYSKGKRASIG